MMLSSAEPICPPAAATLDSRGPLSVCLVSEEFPPEMVGGIATYTLDLARGLTRLGHRVHVITRTWDTSDAIDEMDGVRIHRLRVPEPSWRWGTVYWASHFAGVREIAMWNARVKQTLDQLLEHDRIDVVECPEYHAQTLLHGLCTTRTPIVVRLHTPSFVCRRLNGVGSGASKLDTSLGEFAEYWMSRCASLITSPSRVMADDVTGPWRLRRDRIEVIPNPADERLFSSADHVEPEPGTIVFAGRIERRKGVETLVKAIPLVLRRFPLATFDFYGTDHPSGPGGAMMVSHLRSMLAEAGLPHGVARFHGPQPREALPAIYRRAWIAVAPSLYESFGYACLEPMAAGTAVVASDAGALPELLTHKHDGLLVAPENVEALASALIQLLEEPELRHRLAAEARRTVQRRFSQDAVCRQTAHAYHAVIARRP